MYGDAKRNGKIYKYVRKTPVIGGVFRVANAYAYKGKKECNARIAPLGSWWDRVFKKAVYILFFVELVVLLNNGAISEIKWEPADTIISVFPSILGFGIGVFALLFIMPESFLAFVVDNEKKLNFGPEMVPVDIAYPLVVFTLSLAWAVIYKIFPNELTFFISMFVFFYGLTMAFELISFLLNSSLLIQKISIKKRKEIKKKEDESKLKERLKRKFIK